MQAKCKMIKVYLQTLYPYIMSAILRFLKVMNYDIMCVLADCLHNLNSVSYRTREQRIFNLTL